MSDNGFYPEYIRNSYNSTTENEKSHFKMGEDLNNRFKYIGRCSVSLMIRKRQIKTTMRYYLTSFRMDTEKNKK